MVFWDAPQYDFRCYKLGCKKNGLQSQIFYYHPYALEKYVPIRVQFPRTITVNELIKVTYENDRPGVSARDLHEFLAVGTNFRHWFPRMCEYGFTENTDFSVTDIFVHHSQGGSQSKKDAALTIDMAKEICMLQRTEKGKQARRFFIQLEKDWNSPEKVMARALQIADRKIKNLNAKIEADKPKVLFADAVASSNTSILVGDLAKLLRQNGVEIGQNRLFDWLRNNGFLIKHGERRNMPTQRSMEMKLFEVKETTINNPDGSIRVTRTTKVTGKGQTYFINAFLGGQNDT